MIIKGIYTKVTFSMNRDLLNFGTLLCLKNVTVKKLDFPAHSWLIGRFMPLANQFEFLKILESYICTMHVRNHADKTVIDKFIQQMSSRLPRMQIVYRSI